MNFKAQFIDYLMVQHIYEACYNPSIRHIYKPNGSKETTNSVLRGPHKDIWSKSLSNEWGWLAQDNAHDVQSTDTIDFISKSDVLLGQVTTYSLFVLDYRPLKSEPNRIRITVGGDKLSYAEDSSSSAVNMLEKIN